MPILPDPDFVALFNDPATLKAIATTDEDGTPHVVFKGSPHINEAGQVVLLEIGEYSHTNRNLVRAIWFKHKIALIIKTADNRSFHLVGEPRKALVAGPVYEHHYRTLRARRGDLDLSTVWLIDIERIDEKGKPSFEKANDGRIPLIHLDRIAKPA